MVGTINDVIRHIEKEKNNLKAFNYRDSSGAWHAVSTQEFIHQVHSLVAALKKLGINKGDRVAIIGPVSYNWSLCDMAILLAGGVVIPIFHNISPDHFTYEIEHSEAKVIFVADPTCHLLCQNNKELFRLIISMDETPFFPEEKLLKEILELGEQALAESNGANPEVQAAPDDLATIMYTSGTTSVPKGVELTHKNLVAQTDLVTKGFNFKAVEDRHLSYLPLAHIFGRLMNIIMIYNSVCNYYLGDPLQMVQACQDARPTVLIMVPRVLDKIYKSVLHKIQSTTGLKKKLALWAVHVAESDKKTFFWKIKHWIADHILYSKLRHLFGNSLRFVICGSAKANPKLLTFFQNIGVPLFEGYGLTEACPAITNTPFSLRNGTIGRPLPEVEVKISDEGEIFLRGTIVMRGYYKDPALTAEKLDAEGWLHTGDKGSMDAEGNFIILGRMSEHCKTSYGDFVDVPLLEQQLHDLPYIEMALVIANNRPYVTSLLFPNMEIIEQIKKQKGWENLSTEEFFQQDSVKKEIDFALENINLHLNNWERIRNYRVIPVKATIEGGELSPTLKQRRTFIEKKYKQLIDEMYPEHLMAINF